MLEMTGFGQADSAFETISIDLLVVGTSENLDWQGDASVPCGGVDKHLMSLPMIW
jgi:hypothetical protein